MGAEGIGARVVRKEDKRFITGTGRYTDDVYDRQMSAAVFVRSPHAHAKITSIDTSAAKEMPGVVDVILDAGAADHGVSGKQHPAPTGIRGGAAEPVAGLDEDDRHPLAGGGVGPGDTARTRAGDQHIGGVVPLRHGVAFRAW